MAQRWWLTAALATLAVVAACRESNPYSGNAPPVEPQPNRVAKPWLDAGGHFPIPNLDLPADRLAERVDGAEVKLRRLGCTRLRFWRIERPAADLEALTFADEQGAGALLVDAAGSERSPNAPGDEGWIGTNALYFRSKAVLERLIADGPESAVTLVAAAQRVERALKSGEIAP